MTYPNAEHLMQITAVVVAAPWDAAPVPPGLVRYVHAATVTPKMPMPTLTGMGNGLRGGLGR